MNEKIQALYNLRMENMEKACNHVEPSFVPIVGNTLSWVVGYAGEKSDNLLDHPEKTPEVWKKYFDNVYVDIEWVFGLSTPIRAVQRLGSDAFFISDDGYTLQHKEHCRMNVEDYDDLISDPKGFVIDVLGKRKFPALNSTRSEARNALKDAMLLLNNYNKGYFACMNFAKEEYGILPLVGGHKVYPTLDVLFDRLRGFTGALTDLRRNRNKVLSACDAIEPIYFPLTTKVNGSYPYAHCSLHCPTYLRFDDFRDIYWPSMKRFILEVYSRGSKTMVFMEGTWSRFFDLMVDELPKGSILCMLEDDDIIETTKKIGHHFPIMGGVHSNHLRHSTKQQCIDEAKRILDECAPGGGFVWTTEKSLCTLGDVNIDNLIAVHEFVHNYGRK